MARKPTPEFKKPFEEPKRYLIAGYSGISDKHILTALKAYAVQSGLSAVRVKRVDDPEREAFEAKTRADKLQAQLDKRATPARTAAAEKRRRKRWEELNKEFGAKP